MNRQLYGQVKGVRHYLYFSRRWYICLLISFSLWRFENVILQNYAWQLCKWCQLCQNRLWFSRWITAELKQKSQNARKKSKSSTNDRHLDICTAQFNEAWPYEVSSFRSSCWQRAADRGAALKESGVLVQQLKTRGQDKHPQPDLFTCLLGQLSCKSLTLYGACLSKSLKTLWEWGWCEMA